MSAASVTYAGTVNVATLAAHTGVSIMSGGVGTAAYTLAAPLDATTDQTITLPTGTGELMLNKGAVTITESTVGAGDARLTIGSDVDAGTLTVFNASATKVFEVDGRAEGNVVVGSDLQVNGAFAFGDPTNPTESATYRFSVHPENGLQLEFYNGVAWETMQTWAPPV